MARNGTAPSICEDLSKLVTIEYDNSKIDLDLVVESLRQDRVVLVQKVGAEQADSVIYEVAGSLGLRDALELQAGLAGFFGHRHNIGKHFMSVNARNAYQFVTPHSEGSSFTGMQLASFFCHENSTDGGETILMNVDDSGSGWQSVREQVKRGKLGSKLLAQHEIVRARGLYQLNLPADLLKCDDQVLREHETKISGLTVVDVLAKPVKTYSRVLDRNLNVFWSGVDSADFDSASEYVCMLRQSGLLKEPAGGLELRQLDSIADRRIWHSGVEYAQLFKCKITRKLAPGELIILNNLTWAHAANNWSPDSGERKVAASFA
jgi:hypothetical protein